MNRNYPTSSR